MMGKNKRSAPVSQDVSKRSDGNSDSSPAAAAPATVDASSASNSNKKKKRKLQLQLQAQSPSPAIHFSIPIAIADHDATLALLKTMDWSLAKNTSRRNVIRGDDPSTPRNHRNKPYCMSFIFGRNMKDPTGSLSYWSVKYPEVYAELRNLMFKYDSAFGYTHITLNRNLRCKRHTDGGNAGPSYIAAFGAYAGGELLVEQPGGGMPETLLDLKSKFVMFNGKTQPHETLAFTGERFTLVYYTSDIKSEEGAVDRRRIASVGAAGVSSDFAAKFNEIKATLGKKKPR